MNYKETLQAIDPVKVFKVLDIQSSQQGAYVYFPCICCGQQAVIKAYGDKKNVWYCPECKDKGHIVSLVMAFKNANDSEQWDYDKARRFLVDKALTYSTKPLKRELNITYQLEYVPFLETQGISKETCEKLEIGRPTGKTMLSGCIAFTVYHDEKKIAFYGIRIKDRKQVFHKSFNPEFYLYNFDQIDPEKDVYFTADIFECVKLLQGGNQAICNFGLPYLSNFHVEQLQKCKYLSVVSENGNLGEIRKQLFDSCNNYVRFIKPALKPSE